MNQELLGVDLTKTFALQYLIENIMIVPTLWIFDMLINTGGLSFYKMYVEAGIDNSNWDNYMIVVIIYGLLMSLRPLSDYAYNLELFTDS